MGVIKKFWDKCSLYSKQLIIMFLITIEASLFFRLFIPIEVKEMYGKNFVHVMNLTMHWIILCPVLCKLLNIRGK